MSVKKVSIWRKLRSWWRTVGRTHMTDISIGLRNDNTIDVVSPIRIHVDGDLGTRIGYGRTMQLCEQLWGESERADGLPAGGSHSVYCCVAFLVPCPGRAHQDGQGHKCDWCCGAGRVTRKVAEAVARLEPTT